MQTTSIGLVAILTLCACGGSAPPSQSAAAPASETSAASAPSTAAASTQATTPTSAPASASPTAAAAKKVTGAEAKKLIADGAQFIDVRSKEEFAAGGLPGAKNIPTTDLSTRKSELAKDKPVVVYCGKGVGKKSAEAGATLAAEGYTVYDLGAMTGWEK